jgi:hypothetical protein
MKKVLLMIDCDGCRCLYEHIRTASEDTVAWWVHGQALVKKALRDGWARSDDDNYYFCPECQADCPVEMCLLFE